MNHEFIIAISDRKQRERQARINLILQSAARVFARQGYHNASMDLIAEEAELGKATIYYYYKSKDELLQGILAEGIHEFFINLEKAFEAESDSIMKIRLVIRESVAFFERHPDYFKLYMYLNVHPAFRERIYQSLHPVLVNNLSMLRSVFIQAGKEGQIKEIPGEHLLSIFGSLVMGMDIFSAHLSSDKLRARARWMEEIFLRGILNN